MNSQKLRADFNRLLCTNVLVRAAWMAASHAGATDEEAVLAVALALADQNKKLIDDEIVRRASDPTTYFNLPNPDVVAREAGTRYAEAAARKFAESFGIPQHLVGEPANQNYVAAKHSDEAFGGSPRE